MAEEIEPLARSQRQAERELRQQRRADCQIGPGKPGAMRIGEPVGPIKETLGHDQADQQNNQQQHGGLDDLDQPRSQQLLQPQCQQLFLPFAPDCSLLAFELANLAADPLSRFALVFFLTLALGSLLA